jgi:hypothetical protein
MDGAGRWNITINASGTGRAVKLMPLRLVKFDKHRPARGGWPMVLRWAEKVVIFVRMHFSRHISQLHSTFSLLAALLLRVAR